MNKYLILRICGQIYGAVPYDNENRLPDMVEEMQFLCKRLLEFAYYSKTELEATISAINSNLPYGADLHGGKERFGALIAGASGCERVIVEYNLKKGYVYL